MTDPQHARETPVRTIESLREQYDRLNRRKIQAQTQLESATKQLEELEREAIEQFGTADVEELKVKLAEMERENERRRQEYQELLEGIERDLAQVESATG